MASTRGKFVWYELMTSDTAAAEEFYKKAIGWEAHDSGMPGMSYTVITAGGVGVGGIMEIPEEACAQGVTPGWMGYIAVDDVDAATRQVADAGGGIHMAPMDIPGVIRFSVVADPQGAVFTLCTPLMDMSGDPPPPGTPGHGGWHELKAADGAAAFDFYAGLFGWTKGDAIDIGPMGIYQLFKIAGEDHPTGGIMTKPPGPPRPGWAYYFNTASIRAAAARVTEAGGQIVIPPMQVPGGQWILHARDPQGASFEMIAPGE